MSSRVRHPLKSLILFVVVAGAGYFAWEHRERLRMEGKEFITPEQRQEIRELVVTRFQANEDFLGFRALSWRPRENRYRIEIDVSDGCEDPSGLCRSIADFISDEAGVESTIVATSVRALGINS